MTDFIDGVEKFGTDWWKDMTNPTFGQERNCQNAPIYFSSDCQVEAPDYWKPTSEEPQWTWTLYMQYMQKEADYRNEPIVDEIKDELELDLHEIADDFNLQEMEDEAKRIDGFFEGHEPISYDFVKTFLVCFRWVLNAAFLGIPWMFISYIGVMWNIVLNTIMNHWWAGGNFWLVGNTVFGLMQSLHTWFLIFEWPFYLRHFYVYRILMIIISAVYTTWIFSDGMAVIGMDKWETDETYEKYDLMDMMTDMFLAYNVIMHWPIALTGVVLIVKEIEMMIYQQVTTNGPADYQLSWQNAEWHLAQGLWFLNPLEVIMRIEGFFTKIVKP